LTIFSMLEVASPITTAVCGAIAGGKLAVDASLVAGFANGSGLI
jgi:hypothetical protein